MTPCDLWPHFVKNLYNVIYIAKKVMWPPNLLRRNICQRLMCSAHRMTCNDFYVTFDLFREKVHESPFLPHALTDKVYTWPEEPLTQVLYGVYSDWPLMILMWPLTHLSKFTLLCYNHWTCFKEPMAQDSLGLNTGWPLITPTCH